MDLQFSQRCIINCELSFWNKNWKLSFPTKNAVTINICLILCKSEYGKRKKKKMNIWINVETFQQVSIKSLSAVQWGKMENFFMLKISCFQACSAEALFLNLQRGACSYFLHFYIKANIWKLTTFFYLQTWCCKD